MGLPTYASVPFLPIAVHHEDNSLVVSYYMDVQFSSVAQSCPTLCHPMNRSTPGLPVHHQLRVHSNSCPSSQWCHPITSSSVVPFPSCLQSFPTSESFPMSQLFAWGGQSTRVSALPSVLPMNTQGWFPLGWTGWISLQSKGLSRVFSSTTVQKHQFFGAQPSSQSNSHIQLIKLFIQSSSWASKFLSFFSVTNNSVIIIFILTSLSTCLEDCCCLIAKSCLTLVTPWTVAHQTPLSMGFPRQLE